jgi:adenylyltransferase/sulfurtransferase
MLSDEELLRYSRQLLLPDFDLAGQQRLRDGRVLIVGLGGLGCPAALYLAAAGVGCLLLADGDEVELGNLQRQIAHGQADCGSNKAESVARRIAELNPLVAVEVVPQRLEARSLPGLLDGCDVVVDASDNFVTRFALNRACIDAGIPLVSGAAIRAEAQLAVFHPRRGGPCYRCLYPGAVDDSMLSCSESGVLAPLVGVVGSLQAMETLKLLAGYGETLLGALLVMDLKTAEFRRLTLPRRTGCPDCGTSGEGVLPAG